MSLDLIFNSPLFVACISFVLSAFTGYTSYKYNQMRKIWTKQLELVYAPLHRELDTLSIERKEFSSFVNTIYSIVYENYMYVSFDILDPILSLKKRFENGETSFSSDDIDFNKINVNVTYRYYDLQNKLKLNNSSEIYGKFTLFNIVLYLVYFVRFILYIIPLLMILNLFYSFTRISYLILLYFIFIGFAQCLIYVTDKITKVEIAKIKLSSKQ